MNAHDENLSLLAATLREMARPKYECHSCGEYHSHVVEMFNPDDPEARGEYGPCCIPQKRKDGWRAV